MPRTPTPPRYHPVAARADGTQAIAWAKQHATSDWWMVRHAKTGTVVEAAFAAEIDRDRFRRVFETERAA